MPLRRKGLARVLAAVLVLVPPSLGACAGGDDDDDVATPGEAPATETSDTSGGPGGAGAGDGGETTTTGGQPVDEGTSLVGQARGETLGVWDAPDATNRPDRTLRAAGEPGRRIIVVVKQELGPTWLEVHLPLAPAGGTGWVRRDDVTLSRHRFRIEVARGAHTLTVYAGEVPALETPVAIGPDAPAPTDGLFIKALVQPADAAGPYGRYIYGLSGADSRAEDIAAGTGVVAIHGTDDESTLGQDVGRGSLAIGADELNRLVSSIGLPLGTPVEIVP